MLLCSSTIELPTEPILHLSFRPNFWPQRTSIGFWNGQTESASQDIIQTYLQKSLNVIVENV